MAVDNDLIGFLFGSINEGGFLTLGCFLVGISTYFLRFRTLKVDAFGSTPPLILFLLPEIFLFCLILVLRKSLFD